MSETDELESLRARVAKLEAGVASLARALGMLAQAHQTLCASHERGGRSVTNLCGLLQRLLDVVDRHVSGDAPPPAAPAESGPVLN